MIKNKKGQESILLAIGFLLAVLAILFFYNFQVSDIFIGAKQYNILNSNELASAGQMYIDNSAYYSSERAVDVLLDNSGYYREITETGRQTDLPCGKHVYPAYTNEEKDCIPNYRDSYFAFFRNEFDNYIISFPIYDLKFSYDLSLSEQDTKTLISGKADKKVKVPLMTTTGSKELADQGYPSGALGGYGDEKIIDCASAECLIDVADYFVDQYNDLPYIWGGESPYSYEDTVALQEQSRSFFEGVSVTKAQPGRSSLTLPGFDCSGWVWWVGKHAGVSDLSTRLTADDIYNNIWRAGNQRICKEPELPCTQELILSQAEPGDVMFYKGPTDEKITHIMFYAGGGEIIHSSSRTGPIRETIPSFYLSSKNSNIEAVYRLSFNGGTYETLQAYLDEHDMNNPFDEGGLCSANSKLGCFIGPTAWCSGGEDLPSRKLRDQALSQAWNVPGRNYVDIAISEGIQKSVDPAFLLTSAVLESDLGKNQKCADVQKSTLTGCSWDLSCADDCACGGPDVVSDESQFSCSAGEVRLGYTEAMIGTMEFLYGPYSECKAYNADPDKFWTCILCVSKGSYDKDPTGKGKPYFTQDGTCDYAEDFKEEYCSWRVFLEEEGYDFEGYSGTKKIASSSNYVAFEPQIGALAPIDMKEMDEISAFTINLMGTCYDQLPGCVEDYVEAFNEAHPKIKITMSEEDPLLVYETTDALQSCISNGQKGCICELPENLPEGKVNMFNDGKLTQMFTRLFLPKSLTNTYDSKTNEVMLEVSGQKYTLSSKEVDLGTTSLGQFSSTGVHGSGTNECSFLIDLTDINENALDSTRIDYDRLQQALNTHDSDKFVEAAHEKYPNVPIEFIKGIIGTEVGGENIIDSCLAGTGGCYERLFKGPMQMGPDACADTTTCNYEEISNGNIENAIMSGAEYLNKIISTHKYIDEDEPNFYFVAMAYNAGIGSMSKILEQSSMRTGKDETQLEWEDISYDDVKEGLLSLGSDWAAEEAKWDEVWEYPNLVAIFILEQCGGFIQPEEEEEDDEEASMFSEMPSGNLGFAEYANEYYWVPITEETKHLQCRNNKHFYRFQAHFSFSEKPMGFSVYLDDVVAPELEAKSAKQKTCGGDEALLFSWTMSSENDPAYEFTLSIADQTSPQDIYELQMLTNTAEPLSGVESDITVANQLYYKEIGEKITYYYLLKSIEGQNLVENTTYEYKVTLRDHYNNTQETDIRTVKLQQPIEQTIFDNVAGGEISPLLEQFLKGSLTCMEKDENYLTIQEVITGTDSLSNLRGGDNEYAATAYFVIEKDGLPFSERTSPMDSVVIHYTVTKDVETTYEVLLQQKLSYHYIIDQDGMIYQFVDEDKAAWHAGCANSKEGDCTPGYNSRSIGISFVNCGYREGNTCTFEDPCFVPEGESSHSCWQTYTSQQLDSLAKLVADIDFRSDTFSISEESIVRHSDINVKKPDPGPAFDEAQLIEKALYYLQIHKDNEYEDPKEKEV